MGRVKQIRGKPVIVQPENVAALNLCGPISKDRFGLCVLLAETVRPRSPTYAEAVIGNNGRGDTSRNGR